MYLDSQPTNVAVGLGGVGGGGGENVSSWISVLPNSSSASTLI